MIPSRIMLSALLGSLMQSGASRAADDTKPAEAVKALLAHPIIGPRQSLADTQEFVAGRVPRMPEVKTAEEWTLTAARLRAETLAKVVFRGEAAHWRDLPTKVEWQETIPGGPGYHIKKLRYEVLPGMWIPALLYEPEDLRGVVPVVLNVNGHDGKGKAADYKQVRCINLAKRGMLALNVEWFGMGQLKTDGFQHGLINAIDLCGSSGIATHFLAMKRGIDILLTHENADPTRVGVTGLSGGGWQTSFISPLDPRVTLTDPVAGYSSFVTRIHHFSDLGDSEQTPCDLATVVDYKHLTAMMAPHPTLLTFNAKDNCCFAAPHALQPLVDAAAPMFALYGKSGNLRAHVNHDPGDHNYLLDNRQAFYQMTADHWSTLTDPINPIEVPSDAEVKTAEQLQVTLPADNVDFHKLALALARDLPRKPSVSSRSQRDVLLSVVRPFEGDVQAIRLSSESKDGCNAAYWRLHVGGSWSVPAVEITRGEPKGTVILLADQGRASVAARVIERLDKGLRVLAIDPFYFGEAKPAERDYLWALLISAVGERPLGIQTGQVTSIAHWAKKEFRGASVEVEAIGPRTSVIALTATALEPEAITGLTLTEPLGSLKELIEANHSYTHAPELFHFGLLEAFDVADIAALVAPRPITLRKPSERARAAFPTAGVVSAEKK